MHGHIMFRVHMTEDWLGWGLVLLLFLFGCWSLIMFLKKSVSEKMAINKNHEFEELGGVKCAIVEKNASKERVAFLKDLARIQRL